MGVMRMKNIVLMGLVGTDGKPDAEITAGFNNINSANMFLFFFGIFIGILFGALGFYIYVEIKNYLKEKRKSKNKEEKDTNDRE